MILGVLRTEKGFRDGDVLGAFFLSCVVSWLGLRAGSVLVGAMRREDFGKPAQQIIAELGL